MSTMGHLLEPPAEPPPLDHRWRRYPDGTLVWREDPDDMSCVSVGVPPGPNQERKARELDWWRAYYDDHPPAGLKRRPRNQLELDL